MIEELERSLEGINAGAKEILQKAAASQAGPLREVIGLVADLVSVNVQHAAIVDVALGEIAQYIVVDGHYLVNEIADERIRLEWASRTDSAKQSAYPGGGSQCQPEWCSGSHRPHGPIGASETGFYFVYPQVAGRNLGRQNAG